MLDDSRSRHRSLHRLRCDARSIDHPVKYRYTIVNEGVVEADNKAEAEAAAFQSCDQGLGVFACDVEPLLREVGEE